MPKLVLLVLFVVFVSAVDAVVCLHCNGNIPGCTGTAHCPLMAGVTENVAALAAGAAAVVTVAKILPVKVQRVLPRTVLDTIKALYNAPTGAFDFTGKDVGDVFEAATHGHVSVDEAMVWLQRKMLSESASANVTKIAKTMDTLKELAKSGSADAAKGMDGALMYVWALTDKCIQYGATGVVRPGVEPAPKAAIRLVRPSTMVEFVRRLNLWVMILHATGVVNVVISTKFLEEAIYPVFSAGNEWQVVHELLLVYVRAVEEVEGLNLGNVFASGGQDTKMQEAAKNAAAHFGVDISDA